MQFKGSLAGEHGVGIARTEYLRAQVGEEVYQLMRQIKQSFDPFNLFNPGKIISDGRYKIDHQLRLGAGYSLKLPFKPVLAFSGQGRVVHRQPGTVQRLRRLPQADARHVSHVHGHRRGIHVHARPGQRHPGGAGEARPGQRRPAAFGGTRGGAGQLSFLQGLHRRMPVQRKPGIVESRIAARAHPAPGIEPARAADQLGGCAGPAGLQVAVPGESIPGFPGLRFIESHILGLTTRRPLPHFARERFDHWFAKRPPFRAAYRGRVMLWDDTFVRYHEPHIGRAAVKVLEAAGFEVVLPKQRKCCGRPAFSQGNLDEAARLGRHNLALLNQGRGNTPIIFLEPRAIRCSCRIIAS